MTGLADSAWLVSSKMAWRGRQSDEKDGNGAQHLALWFKIACKGRICRLDSSGGPDGVRLVRSY